MMAADEGRTRRWSRTKKVWVTLGSIFGGLIALAAAAVAALIIYVDTYEDPWLTAVADAGYVQKTAQVGEVDFSYVEGPDNGEPLVLLHAQLMDWFDHSRVMPELAENYHVFVVDRYVFPGSASVVKGLVESYRAANPGEPVEIGVIPDETVKLLLRGLDQYDPRFGAAFYDGTWNEGFDHAEALARVTCPVLLIQADFGYLDDGTLDGAMSQADADKAMALLQDGEYVKVDSGHVVHLEAPDEFVTLLDGFLQAH